MLHHTRSPGTHINRLPAHVLLLILRHVFSHVSGPRMRIPSLEEISLNTWASVQASSEQTVEHPAPECLASVCSHWREVMSNATVFWTSFVV